jgi:histidinol-phosphate aminotransferase
LIHGFDRLGLNYIPSAGNFIAVEIPGNADRIYQRLLKHGVIVRPIGLYEMPDHLRVSIGLPEENERFLDVLGSLLGSGGQSE